jgi:hypothetical protein
MALVAPVAPGCLLCRPSEPGFDAVVRKWCIPNQVWREWAIQRAGRGRAYRCRVVGLGRCRRHHRHRPHIHDRPVHARLHNYRRPHGHHQCDLRRVFGFFKRQDSEPAANLLLRICHSTRDRHLLRAENTWLPFPLYDAVAGDGRQCRDHSRFFR